MITKAGKSAQKLLQMLVEDFSSFRDVAEFEGKKGTLSVLHFRHAHIRVAWRPHSDEGEENFRNVCVRVRWPVCGLARQHTHILSTQVEICERLKLVGMKTVHLRTQDKCEDTISACTVAIYKRAQILIADVWACCGGVGYGEFTDIDTVTMFADYRCVLLQRQTPNLPKTSANAQVFLFSVWLERLLTAVAMANS